MDIKWIEDFLALVEQGSFTKAAEKRFVTQPAFSRRIRSLENWLGVSLVDRNAFPTKLTKTGEEFVEPMREALNKVYGLRAQMQESSAHEQMLILSTQHSLSVSFFPKWYHRIKSALGHPGISVNASNLHDCIDLFLAGQSDLLLCYYSPDIYPELERQNIISMEIGDEQLIPVYACNASVSSCPIEEIEGANEPVQLKLVGFPSGSFFGRLVQQQCFPKVPGAVHFELACETALTESIKAMVLQGIGMAWLPASLIEQELKRGELKQLPDLPTTNLKIMLYRQKSTRTEEIDSFWGYLLENG
ncbi:LysR family transcriptional regulator [Motiliproteus sp. MSK22-1]|uniref:LysR family transcriptional regulator n=1 Tax=Motiliproteus sp. MSK22-1 TaxID=1897630 RepID=UPI000978504B|nr:LysR family transcriptional regulator [Motiliproteus sp. MSK22-1]OMH30781.1 hypothetical protein BGP75_17285 [Motiliproteus sp. MSK22-1]